MRAKRILLSIFVAVLAVLLVASTVMAAWSFAFPISVADTGGTDRTYVPVLTGVTGVSLSSAGYMNATGTDTNMQIGSSSVPYMLSTTQIATVAPTLYSGSHITYNLYTGYTPVQTAFSIITGTGGYITTSDDTDLELGDTFIVETKGYVDTDSGSDKNIVYKEDAFGIYVSDDEEITSGFLGSLSEYSSSSDGGIYATDIDYATAQAVASGTVSDNAATFRIGQSYVDYETYPVVEAVNGGNDGSGTEHSVSLPASIAEGDLLIVFFSAANSAITFPDGWTSLFQSISAITRFGACYRIADGGEGATITVATATSVPTAHTSYRISGYGGRLEVGTSATGNSTQPNPPNLTPSWGSEETLWLSVCGYYDGTTTVSNYPVNYTDGRNDRYNNGAGVGVGSARRGLEAASENPGIFTISAVEYWVANTIALYSAGYEVDRGFLYFDTSAIPDGATIVSANLKLYGSADSSDTDFNLTITNGQPTYPTDPLAAGDFDIANYSGSGGTLTTSGFSTSGYNTISLNSTGRGWINDTGTTKLCIVSDEDIAESAPTGDEYVVVYSTNETGTSKDPYLEVVYANPAVSVSSIESQLMTVKTTADGSDLLLQVYDSDDELLGSDTTALSGASVTDNSNDYIWGDGDVAPYFTYIKMTTAIGGSSEKLWYQPIGMITATTLPDRDTTDGANDGTITWGSNSDMTVTMGSVVTYESASSTAGEEGGYAIIDMETSGGWYGGGDISGLPLYENFSDISTDTGIPVRTLYIFGIFAVALALGFGVFLVFKPMIFGFIASLVVLWAGSSMGIVPGWIIFSYAVMGFGIVYLRRQM